MAEPNRLPWFFPIIISGKSGRGCWWFGRSVLIGQLQSWTLSPKLVGYYMDGVLWARIVGHDIERWPSLTDSPDFSLSLFEEKTKWSVGWSVANVSKGSCPRSPINCPRHFQTSKGTNTNNFYINHIHPRHPQTPLTKFKKIQILTDFKIHAYDWRKKVVKYQLQPNILDFILASHTWTDSSQPKGGLIILKNEIATLEPLNFPYH